MSKVDIDYSNTIIYKITCNDSNVNHVYVGHTTNFVQRKHAHKQSCINEKSPNNKSKLYEVIRANGGWLNWNMEIIHFCNCKNHYEARIKEQEYFILLKANLNSIEPMPPKKTILVKSSPTPSANAYGDQTITLCAVDTNKIEPTSDISTNNTKKIIKKHRCEMCDFKCTRQSEWSIHIHRPKHINRLNGNPFETKKSQDSTFICECGKKYISKSGLWKHQKLCSIKINNNIENDVISSDNLPINNLILEILKQNQDFKEMILEKQLPTENNNSLIIELLKQNQDIKNLMIEQNKYMMEQSKQLMDIAKNTENKTKCNSTTH